MKTTLAVLGLSVALIGGTTAASAKPTTRTPTTIVTTSIGPVSPGKFGAFGYLKTPPRCRGDRRVKVLFRYGSDTTWTPVDLGTSTGQGAWGGIGARVGPSGSITHIKVQVSRDRIGRSRRVCGAASVIHEVALGQHSTLRAAGPAGAANSASPRNSSP
jgi:hypothetical protein